MDFWLPPRYGLIRDGTLNRITSLNDEGAVAIQNEVYLAGSIPVIAGFSKIFQMPRGTRTIQIGGDFIASGEISAVGLSFGYAQASFHVNIKAMGLGLFGVPNGDNRTLKKLIFAQFSGFYYQSPGIGRFFDWYWRTDMDAFTPAASTQQYMLSATIESFAGCGGLGSFALANVFGSTRFQGFFITTDP